MIHSGEVVFSLFLALPLAAAGGWLVARGYRRKMVALMTRGAAPNDAALPGVPAGAVGEQRRSPVLADLSGHRRALFKLLLALSGLSLLVALSQSGFALHFVYARGLVFSPLQWLMMGLIMAWPMVLGWGLALAWPWRRTVAVLAAYFAALAPLAMLASNEAQTLIQVLTLYAILAAAPLAAVLAISASGRIRAVAPYLLPVFLILVAVSQLGLDLLAAPVAREAQDWPGWLSALVGNLGAWPTFLLFAVAPWFLAAWPVYALGRGLAAAYREKRYSDLIYLFAVYWLLVLMLCALLGLGSAGPGALLQILAWLWLPLGFVLLRPWLAPRGAPPTLLVLRVFRRDEAVEELFDRVIERWRLTGNTVLIAGTDLASRTLDADDLFAYLNGRLAERFIASPEEIPERLAALDLAPDADGRYRVNECYCFDTTWQAALLALVARSDLVLMDLRGFQAENRGCLFELGVLSHSPHLRRLVLLHDGGKSLALAQAALGRARPEVLWLEARRLDGAMAQSLLSALLAPPDTPAG